MFSHRVLLLILVSLCAAAEEPLVRALSPGEKIAAMAAREANRHTRHAMRAGSVHQPAVVVFSGDSVIPQVVDGAGWQTTMTFVNLKAATNRFQVWLFTDNGGDMFIDFPGVGKADAINVTLPPNMALTVETPGTATSLNQGWAYIYSEEASVEIGSMSIFRQRVAGRPDNEAAVPTVSEFDDRFVLTYDNTRGFVTAYAIANPDVKEISIDATVRDEDDHILNREVFTIGKFSKVVFTLPARWSASASKRGVVEFRASGYGASALGLRFNPGGAFTSFHAMRNAKWTSSTTQTVQ